MSSAGITKRDNRYLRKQLVHGARAVLSRSKTKSDRLSRWTQQLVARRGVPRASVALAARIARLSWVLLQKQEPYQPKADIRWVYCPVIVADSIMIKAVNPT